MSIGFHFGGHLCAWINSILLALIMKNLHAAANSAMKYKGSVNKQFHKHIARKVQGTQCQIYHCVELAVIKKIPPKRHLSLYYCKMHPLLTAWLWRSLGRLPKVIGLIFNGCVTLPGTFHGLSTGLMPRTLPSWSDGSLSAADVSECHSRCFRGIQNKSIYGNGLGQRRERYRDGKYFLFTLGEKCDSSLAEAEQG